MQIDSIEQSCICQSAYFNNSVACLPCMFGCSACSNGNTCDTCNAGQNWMKNVSDNTCICANHFFLTTINTTKNCSSCD
jgi:hypothetical protein